MHAHTSDIQPLEGVLKGGVKSATCMECHNSGKKKERERLSLLPGKKHNRKKVGLSEKALPRLTLQRSAKDASDVQPFIQIRWRFMCVSP